MEWRFRYLFTLCLIMGFQIHVPVTMFPANGVSQEHSDIGEGMGDYLTDVLPIEKKSSPLKQNVNTNKDHRAAELIKSSLIQSEQHSLLGASGLEYIPTDDLNRKVNQAIKTDLYDFKSGVKLNGLERDPSTYYDKSLNSVINRLPTDLPYNKLQLLERKLVNLSTNLLTRKHSLHGNNSTVVVNGNRMTVDEIDKVHKEAEIKSATFQPIQPVNVEINTDTLQGRTENNHNNVKGIQWSDSVVNKCPGGISKANEIDTWKQKLKRLHVVKIETGCGSMQNRLITFNDSTKACVRYRLNSDQMQGDIYSFYLGKLLDMDYTPSTTLQMLENKQLWRKVMGDINTAKWSEDKPLIVTKWEDSLEPVFMPDKLKDMKRILHQENYQLDGMTPGDLCDLVQWSDLIVFDYISANLDRVVNNMFNLQWNHKMLEKPIHNLERSKETGQLLFLDNESGLFHGYRLLDAYEKYHKTLLDSVCVFKPSTIKAVKHLYANANTGEMLQNLYETNEPYHGHLPKMSKQNMQLLQSRVNTVYKHMELCEHIR